MTRLVSTSLLLYNPFSTLKYFAFTCTLLYFTCTLLVRSEESFSVLLTWPPCFMLSKFLSSEILGSPFGTGGGNEVLGDRSECSAHYHDNHGGTVGNRGWGTDYCALL